MPASRTRNRNRTLDLAVFTGAVMVAVVFRRPLLVGVVLVGLVLVPLERVVPLCRQRVVRPGLLSDLNHLLVNGVLVTAATVVLVVGATLPLLPIRSLDLEGLLPERVAITLAVVLALTGSYWGHRLTHEVPLLWRFHSVHHSIEHMDWVAAARLHPIDAAFTQTCTAMPLVVLGYQIGVLAGVTVFVTLLAIFQHANVRIRFPVLRWIVPTPEWHHWHHASDAIAHDTNFGLPAIDVVFGTAYIPAGRRPSAFGIDDPVPPEGYIAQLRYPLSSSRSPGGSRSDGSDFQPTFG